MKAKVWKEITGKTNPADEIERWSLDKLTPYARNSRTHSDEQVAQLAASIREWGWTTPVLADEDGGIIAGHGRVLAARQLGMVEVPVVVARGWSDAKRRAYVIADNKLALNAGWDSELLALELGELGELGFDLELTGFDGDELAALTPEVLPEGKTDPDEVPEVPPTPRSVLGDVWLLGKHRVMCGDSTSIDAVETLMAGGKADCVWTDPPYGVNMASVNESLAKVGKASKTRAQHGLENDDLNDDELTDFLRASLGAAFANCRDGAAWYVAAPSGPLFHCFGTVLKDLDVWRHTLAWVKSTFVLGRSDYHYQHEPIFYGWKPGAAHTWASDRKQSSTLNFDKPSRNGEHPTMKPVELVEYCIGNSSNRGDVVLEPFGGSGTTLIACEKTGRIARLMELDPRYVDVIVKRWQDYTGKKATREADGVAFDEVG
jgi:DNA modification methylase